MTGERILLTGGAGYIGTHVGLQLLQEGFEVHILDNFSNSSPLAVERLCHLTNKPVGQTQGDVRDKALLDQLFAEHAFAGVIHFAGLKAVGDSVKDPCSYYDVNVGGALSLVEAMGRHQAQTLIFSSSATVYGAASRNPIAEHEPLGPANPYGRTKLQIEEILWDIAQSDPAKRFLSLRYFNPVGAHVSGMIGEDPSGVPNNLFPYIAQVATGRMEYLRVFGADYPTADGTGVRDYIHIVDLADGHVAALKYLLRAPQGIPRAINLGTGQGVSVLEAIAAWGAATGKEIPYQLQERRPGDVAETFADPSLAKSLLGWEAKHDLRQMCEDHWRWQSQNPAGYF